MGKRQREAEKWSGTPCQFDLSRKEKKEREDIRDDTTEKVKDTEERDDSETGLVLVSE